MQLFRQQALDHQNRLHGEIFLAPPLRWQAIGWLLLVLVIACALFLAMTSYNQAVSATGTIRAVMVKASDGIHRSAPAYPKETGWIAELLIPLARGAQIDPGQPVTLAVAGYPAQEFGTLQGRVIATGAPVTGSDAPYVPVTARLEAPGPQQAARGLMLRTDMRVEASIVVGRVSLLRWLFEPLFANAR